MKIKTLEQMTKAELINQLRSKDAALAQANTINQGLAKDLRAAQEDGDALARQLKRANAECSNYFQHFIDLMQITKNLANKVGDS